MSAAAAARGLLGRPSFLASLVFAASLVAYACGGSATRGARDARSPVERTGRQGAACVDQLPLEDCVDYAFERELAVGMLGDLEATQDRRSIPVAEVALRSRDPVVTEAGLRLLGPFAASEPRAAELAVHELMSPYVASSQLAGRIVRDSSRYAELGRQYSIGHDGPELEVDPWAKAPSLSFASVGFKGPYPSSTPYAPCDSPNSIGFATEDTVDRVLAHYRSELGVEKVALSDVQQRVALRAQGETQKVLEKMQELQLEYARTQDPKAFERMQQVSDGLSKTESAAFQKLPLPSATAAPSAQAFVAQEAAGNIERLVVVYREPLVERTIVMLAWLGPHFPPVPRVAKQLGPLTDL